MTGGITVIAADFAFPLGSVAVMLTDAFAATGYEATEKVPEVAPPAIVIDAGTDAAALLLLFSATLRPPGGAGPVSTRVAEERAPPVSVPGLKVKELIAAGLTDRVAWALVEPSVAVTRTLFAVATAAVAAVNVCEDLPPGIMTPAGTPTEASELLRLTVIPPAGAARLSLTVPVELAPPVTDEGLKDTP